MHRWTEPLKQSLRHLAAARFYLPASLDTPLEWEQQYVEYLHHRELGLALEDLVAIGEAHTGYAGEQLFWLEVLKAAELMQRGELAARCGKKLCEISGGENCSS